MSCQEVVEWMHRYLDHDLNDVDEQHLSRHLLECSDCAALFERLKRVSSELENLPKVVPAFSLVDAIMPQLEQYEREGSLPAGQTSSPASSPVEERAASGGSGVERIRRMFHRRPYKTIGGVVAAGLIVGLFLTTYQPKTVQDAEGYYEGQMSNEAASPETRALAADQDAASDAPFMEEAMPKMDDTSKGVPPKTDSGEPAASAKNPSARSIDSEADRLDQELDAPLYSIAAPSSSGTDNDLPESPVEPAAPGHEHQPEVAPPSIAPEEPNEGQDDSIDMMQVPEAEDSSGPPPVKENGIESIVDDPAYESPDGTMQFSIEREQLLIYHAGKPRKLVFESPVHRGTIVYAEWSEDSKQVTYEMAHEGVLTRYKIDVELRLEWMEAIVQEDADLSFDGN